MRTRRTAAAVVLAVPALACSAPAQLRYEEELARTPAAAEHAVHSTRLRELMRGLDRLRTERLPQAMDVGDEREARREIVARVALEMAASAEQIPDAADEASLDADERREFQARADELRQRARRLAERAQATPPGDLDAELAAALATCDGCHERFRSGDLPDDG